MAVLIICELIYQCNNMYETEWMIDKYENGTTDLTVEEFKKRVANGEDLVILDDMVLNVSWFKTEHPGGQFSIEMNLGRDVSKYFYGGYSLENIDKVWEHVHSNDARNIVNQLVVGRLSNKAPRNLMTISKVDRVANVSGSAKTVSFVVSGSGAINDSYQPLTEMAPCALIDHRQIARHFVVKTTSN